jgi:hypothetical protein
MNRVGIANPDVSTSNPDIELPSFVLKIQDRASFDNTDINEERLAKFIVLTKRKILEKIGDLEEEYDHKKHEKIYRSVLREAGIAQNKDKIEQFFRVIAQHGGQEFHLKSALMYYYRIKGRLSDQTVSIINNRLRDDHIRPDILFYVARNKGGLSEDIEIPVQDQFRLFQYLWKQVQRSRERDEKNISITELNHLYKSGALIVKHYWEQQKGQDVFEQLVRLAREVQTSDRHVYQQICYGLTELAKQNQEKKSVIRKVVDVLSDLMLNEDIPYKIRDFVFGASIQEIVTPIYDRQPNSNIAEIVIQKFSESKTIRTQAALLQSVTSVKSQDVLRNAIQLYDKSKIGTVEWHRILLYFARGRRKMITAKLVEQVKKLEYSADAIKRYRQKTEYWKYKKRIRNKAFPRSPQRSLATVLQYLPGDDDLKIDMSSPEKAKESIMDWWEQNKNNPAYHYTDKSGSQSDN